MIEKRTVQANNVSRTGFGACRDRPPAFLLNINRSIKATCCFKKTVVYAAGQHQSPAGFDEDYAFFTLDLHRITATTDVLNTPSYTLLERLGFRREGHYLENVWFKGAWGDEYLYAMLQREWRLRRS